MDVVAPKVFQFDGFTLDAMRRFLRKGERQIELRPKSFDVLCCLVENSGRLVTKDEIIAAVWPNVIVTDESLTRCVSDVRLALGDNELKLIKTIPRRGYMFVAPVSRVSSETSAYPVSEYVSAGGLDVTASRAGRAKRTVWAQSAFAAALLLIVIGATLAIWRQPSGLPMPDRPSIAVLPFSNASDDARQDYFAEGIWEDITTSLSKFADLFVIARDSASRYKDQKVGAKQIGGELGVRYVLQGSVRKNAERVQISAQLVEAASGAELWAERVDRELSGIFSLRDDVTQKIVVTLLAHMSKSELDRVLRKPPESLIAYDYTLRANALMKIVPRNKRGETIADARNLYGQAIAADPRYAPAIQGLANTYLDAWLEPSPGHPIGQEFQQQPIIDRAQSLAQSAVDMDGALVEARATLGWILNWQYQLKDGILEFDRAFELNPNFVDGRYGLLLSHAGRAPEAVVYMKRIMRLDPHHPPHYGYRLGKAYFFVGSYEQAAELIKSATLRLPGHLPSRVMLAAVSSKLGREEEARSAAADVMRIKADFTIAGWLKFLRITNKEYSDRLAEALQKTGLPD